MASVIGHCLACTCMNRNVIMLKLPCVTINASLGARLLTDANERLL